MTKVESINQLVRAVCVLALLGGFIFAFVVGVLTQKPLIDGATYIGVLTLALTWWFKSRDEKAATETTAATVAAATNTILPPKETT